MSLIKLAFNIDFLSNKKTGIAKHIQRTALSTAGNIKTELKNGKKIKGFFAKHSNGLKFLENLHNKTGLVGAIINGPSENQLKKFPEAIRKKIKFKGLMNEAIDDEGKFNISNIEHRLNQANRYHGKMEKIKKIPVASISLGAGAITGYATGEKDHKLKSTLKGAGIGASIGGSLRGGIHLITNHDIYKAIPKIHKSYFEDNYWKTQLEAANTGVHRKAGKWASRNMTV